MKKFKKTVSLIMMSAILVLPTVMPVQAEEIQNTEEVGVVVAAVNKSDFETPAKITGDGVRLRKTPGMDGVILESMEKGEKVLVDTNKSVYVADQGHLVKWYYCYRTKTKTVGYVYESYVRFT